MIQTNKHHIPGGYFIVAVPGSKAIRMLLNNVFYTVKPMLRIHGVVCHFCKIGGKVSFSKARKVDNNSSFEI